MELELNKKYREGLKELKEEIQEESPCWIKDRRRIYLVNEIIKCLVFLIPFSEWYRDATDRNVDYLTKRIIQIFLKYEYWKKRLHKFSMEYKFTILRKVNGNKITPDMIERAREYPIKDIIEVKKNGFSLCPGHDDHHPSMDCRNNFCFCYVCGWSGDSISLYMKKHNTDFTTAVEFLAG